ncbi:MAG: hypothetical protein HY482_01055 [Candidatus Wildermuthbacteria bacterium]|nr:hypothetical protein [Candidatus Wildermuthbacteria bacterium]
MQPKFKRTMITEDTTLASALLDGEEGETPETPAEEAGTTEEAGEETKEEM